MRIALGWVLSGGAAVLHLALLAGVRRGREAPGGARGWWSAYHIDGANLAGLGALLAALVVAGFPARQALTLSFGCAMWDLALDWAGAAGRAGARRGRRVRQGLASTAGVLLAMAAAGARPLLSGPLEALLRIAGPAR